MNPIGTAISTVVEVLAVLFVADLVALARQRHDHPDDD